MPRIFLHIGATKTGTTYVQNLLFDNRDELASRGVLYPGHYGEAHYEAVQDLRGISIGGRGDTSVRGRWRRLVEQSVRWSGEAVVISHELLGGSSDAAAARAVDSFEGAQLHVVLTARDLGRQVPAMWQEYVKNHGTVPFDAYVRRIAREPRRSRVAQLFWRQQHVAEIAERWCRHVPAERFHLVTVPPPGAAPDLLWQRVTSVVGIDPTGIGAERARSNTSLSYAQAELLRRINQSLGDQLDWSAYERTVKHRFAECLLATGGGDPRPSVSMEQRPWFEQRHRDIVSSLRALGVDVVGDLGDLEPRFGGAAGDDGPELEDVVAAAAASLAELLRQQAERVAGGRGTQLAAKARRNGVVRALPDGVQEWLKRRVDR
ncbi:MAG: hypothetical protein M3419_03950 [Actinomycetota bacterium]|nr:hypothetical protein [Actinomycetota bacterium]